MSNGNFPVKPIEDWVIIKKIDIKDNYEKTGKRINIEMVGGAAPKNIMDIERQKAQEHLTYAESEEKLLKRWDAHPSQGIVKAVGPGRMSLDGIMINVPVKPGDHVYLRGQTGEPVIVNKKLYWMYKAHEIYAVVDNQK